MYEVVHPVRALTKYELPEKSYVLINKFDEESFGSLIKDSEAVLRTGQSFLPVIIDSFGGISYSLFAMIDFLSNITVPVITIAVGKAMSCGALLLSAGQERYVSPNACVMIHELSNGSGFFAKATDVSNDTKELNRLNKLLFRILDRNTKQKPGYWKKLCDQNKNADLYLTPNLCKKHNLATRIGMPHIETTIEVRKELVL